jgi:hypothetical protein
MATGRSVPPPEELARMHASRLAGRASLGNLPLIVLARTHGDYPDGMKISADSLERERHSGHNIHIEDPELVVHAIRTVVERARHL